MKKTVILTMILSILIMAFCLNSYAQDLSSEITTLEQKAERIQSQINQAKATEQLSLDQQAQAIAASIDSLVKRGYSWMHTFLAWKARWRILRRVPRRI